MNNILLLHGAIGAKDQLQPLAKMLENNAEVLSMDFPGHGERPSIKEDFSIEFFAQDVIRFLNAQQQKQIDIVGYSMGGYVALYLAKNYSNYVGKIVTLATKFYWDEAVAMKEIKMLSSEKILEKLPAFAQTLEKRHVASDWKVVLNKTQTMLQNMGQNNPLKLNDYTNINHNCLITLGDRDKMVSLAETHDVYNTLPNATFAVLPNTSHPIEQVNLDIFASCIKQFFQ